MSSLRASSWRRDAACWFLFASSVGACTFPEYDLYRGAAVSGAGAAPFIVAGGGGSSGGSVSTAKACQPSATDELCDGLDEACEPTVNESACSRDCTGVAVNGTSYMLCSVNDSFAQAEARCLEEGMHLAKIDDENENELARDLTSNLGPYVWIGASNRADLDAFAWTDGDIFYRSGETVAGRYENFVQGQPTHYPDSRCVQLEPRNDGVWSEAQCSDTQQLICERY